MHLSQWRSVLSFVFVGVALVGTFVVLMLVLAPSAGAAGGCGGG